MNKQFPLISINDCKEVLIMNKQFPLISIDYYNVSKVKASTLRSLVTFEKCRYRMNKKTLLDLYNDLYGIIITESQALFLVKSICEYNGLTFDREKWSNEYKKWVSSGKSYSIRFF